MVQRQLDVDILITGHTHKNEVNEYEGKWFINPGSITGAYRSVQSDILHYSFNSCVYCLLYFLISKKTKSTLTSEVTPSFILLAIQGSKVVTYVYELHGDQVNLVNLLESTQSF